MIKVIFIDDEPWMLKQFQQECKNIKSLVLQASFRNPVEAINYIKTNPVDLAFLDIEMPEMSGFEAANELRKIDPNIKIIFISAYDHYILEAFDNAKADGFISKPYRCSDIEDALAKIKFS